MQSMQETSPITMQARRQDSVTGGHKQIWAGHKKFIASNSREWTKKQRFLSQISTMSGVKTKKKKDFISKNTRISTISGMKLQKKGSLMQNLQKTVLITNSWMTTSILGVSGLELLLSGTKPVNFFGAQSLLWGEQFSFGGHKR